MLLTATWEALALLGALTLMTALAQGAALTLCVVVLSGWCMLLLVRGTPHRDNNHRKAVRISNVDGRPSPARVHDPRMLHNDTQSVRVSAHVEAPGPEEGAAAR